MAAVIEDWKTPGPESSTGDIKPLYCKIAFRLALGGCNCFHFVANSFQLPFSPFL
jgi:hypothetical protein